MYLYVFGLSMTDHEHDEFVMDSTCILCGPIWINKEQQTNSVHYGFNIIMLVLLPFSFLHFY